MQETYNQMGFALLAMVFMACALGILISLILHYRANTNKVVIAKRNWRYQLAMLENANWARRNNKPISTLQQMNKASLEHVMKTNENESKQKELFYY